MINQVSFFILTHSALRFLYQQDFWCRKNLTMEQLLEKQFHRALIRSYIKRRSLMDKRINVKLHVEDEESPPGWTWCWHIIHRPLKDRSASRWNSRSWIWKPQKLRHWRSHIWMMQTRKEKSIIKRKKKISQPLRFRNYSGNYWKITRMIDDFLNWSTSLVGASKIINNART